MPDLNAQTAKKHPLESKRELTPPGRLFRCMDRAIRILFLLAFTDTQNQKARMLLVSKLISSAVQVSAGVPRLYVLFMEFM